MNESFKRGFSKGWRDHRDGNPPQTDFAHNTRDYTEGYRQGQMESDYELKRDGREAALMDFQVNVYETALHHARVPRTLPETGPRTGPEPGPIRFLERHPRSGLRPPRLPRILRGTLRPGA